MTNTKRKILDMVNEQEIFTLYVLDQNVEIDGETFDLSEVTKNDLRKHARFSFDLDDTDEYTFEQFKVLFAKRIMDIEMFEYSHLRSEIIQKVLDAKSPIVLRNVRSWMEAHYIETQMLEAYVRVSASRGWRTIIREGVFLDEAEALEKAECISNEITQFRVSKRIWIPGGTSRFQQEVHSYCKNEYDD